MNKQKVIANLKHIISEIKRRNTDEEDLHIHIIMTNRVQETEIYDMNVFEEYVKKVKSQEE